MNEETQMVEETVNEDINPFENDIQDNSQQMKLTK